jgi:hypothetical protein
MKIYIFVMIVITGFSAGAQNVGIGLTNPVRAKLEVEGVAGAGATAGLFGTGNAGISFQRNWPTIGFNQYRDVTTPGSQGRYMANGYAAIQYLDPTTGTFVIDNFSSGLANGFTFTAVRGITVLNNGNTYIQAPTSYAGSLVVGRGNPSSDGTVILAGSAHSSHFNYSLSEDTYIRPGLNEGSVLINNIPNGKIMIGTTSTRIGINKPGVVPTNTIDINQPAGEKAFSLTDVNNYKWAFVAQNTNTLDYGQGITLDLYYQNAGKGRFQFWNGAYAVFSDARLKKNVQPMRAVLPALSGLEAVSYEMKNNNPDHQRTIGMIAQDVQKVFPEMVRSVAPLNKEGKHGAASLVMDYSRFGVIAIKALQEQEEQIKMLERKRDLLIKEMESLELALSKQ